MTPEAIEGTARACREAPAGPSAEDPHLNKRRPGAKVAQLLALDLRSCRGTEAKAAGLRLSTDEAPPLRGDERAAEALPRLAED